jgi:hypothetical protein
MKARKKGKGENKSHRLLLSSRLFVVLTVEVVSDNVIVVRLFVRTLNNLKVITLLICI